jgi:hypothetical protein
MTSTKTSTTFDIEEELSALAKKWPSTFVARASFKEFSGGLVSPKTLANLDAQGEGPAVRIPDSGGKVAYTLDSAIEFLRSRMKPTSKSTTAAQGAASKKRAAKRVEVAHG